MKIHQNTKIKLLQTKTWQLIVTFLILEEGRELQRKLYICKNKQAIILPKKKKRKSCVLKFFVQSAVCSSPVSYVLKNVELKTVEWWEFMYVRKSLHHPYLLVLIISHALAMLFNKWCAHSLLTASTSSCVVSFLLARMDSQANSLLVPFCKQMSAVPVCPRPRCRPKLLKILQIPGFPS